MKEIKYCPYCRAEIAEGQKFCSACGKQIPVISSSAEPLPSAESMSSSTGTPANKNNTLLYVLIAVMTIITLGLFFTVSRMENSSSYGTEDTAVLEKDEHLYEDEFQPDDEYQQDIDFKTQYDFACERLVTERDLQGLDSEDLRIMRNWIYARHGYIFKSQDLKDYFSMLPWYKPRYADVSSQLSSIEKENVAFIKRHE